MSVQPAARGCAYRLYVESQERHIMGVMEGAQQQYRDRGAVLLQRKQESEDREASQA